MTNRELLKLNFGNQLLTTIESQRRFLLQQAAKRKPCPNCATELNQFEAANIDIDDWSFDAEPRKYECQVCQRELVFILPLQGGWLWMLVPVKAHP